MANFGSTSMARFSSETASAASPRCALRASFHKVKRPTLQGVCCSSLKTRFALPIECSYRGIQNGRLTRNFIHLLQPILCVGQIRGLESRKHPAETYQHLGVGQPARGHRPGGNASPKVSLLSCAVETSNSVPVRWTLRVYQLSDQVL